MNNKLIRTDTFLYKIKTFLQKVFKKNQCNNEYKGEEKLKVFTGCIKEYITCHKSINSIKWIGQRNLEDYIFNDEYKMILNDYFEA